MAPTSAAMAGPCGLAVVLAWALSVSVVAADCAAGSSTLTTEDCSACNEYAVCLGYTSADDCSGTYCETSGDCTYNCMNVSDTTSSLTILIDFGGYRSSKEVASIKAGSYSESDFNSYPDDTDEWPSVSNDDVTTVSTIEVPSSVATFIMSGGTAAVDYPRGKVASVTLTDKFVSLDSSLTKVVIQNLDLQAQLTTLTSFLPSAVETVDLSNTLISSFPTVLGDLSSLQQLTLDNNYMTSIETADVIGSLTMLSLENNDIDTFTGVFSKLEYLYLGENNLTSIPTAIYSHTNLKALNLTGNCFTSRDFTQAQAEFLSGLETLVLTASDFTADLDCDDSHQMAVHDLTVCLTDAVATTSTTTTSSTNSDTTSSSTSATSSPDSNGSDAQTASASGGSSSTSMVFGIVCGVLVAVIIAILFVFYRRRRGNPSGKMTQRSSMEIDSLSSSTVERNPGYGQLRTSTGLTMGIPMSDSGIAQGIPTVLYDASTGIPTTDDDISTSALATREIPSTRKQKEFLSIWTDPDLLSLQVRAEDIDDLHEIGSGAYATVWLVRYRDSQVLASKRLRSERRQKKHTAMFVEEIKLLASFDHPNLVKVIGAAWTIESDLQMLLEFMDGGDLRRYLSDPSTPCGWTYRKFDIAIGIIEALVYLHSFVPPLIHRDLKSKNVLLSADYTAKLSDFGTSRFRSVESTMTAGVGTGRWLAPEVIRGDADYGPAADIYSFGALLTELDTNQIPYNNVRGENGKKLSEMTILHRVATGTLRPEVRSSCGAELRALVERCLEKHPRDRPAATFIAYELRVIQREMASSLHKGLVRRHQDDDDEFSPSFIVP